MNFRGQANKRDQKTKANTRLGMLVRHEDALQHTATHCNTLQHNATHCNTLQHTATHCNTLQHTATHCNTEANTRLGMLVRHEDALQHTATHCNTLQHTATHCNTLQHTAIHCNTLQHRSQYTPGYAGQTRGRQSAHCLLLYTATMWRSTQSAKQRDLDN